MSELLSLHALAVIRQETRLCVLGHADRFEFVVELHKQQAMLVGAGRCVDNYPHRQRKQTPTSESPMRRPLIDEVIYERGGRRAIVTLQKPCGPEKRLQHRHALHQRVQLVPLRDNGQADWRAAGPAVSRNVSLTGMAILQPYLQDTERVLIGVPSASRMLYLPAAICRDQPLDGHLVELGCRFQMQSSWLEHEPARVMQSMIEQYRAAANGPDERRAHRRASYTGRIGILHGAHDRPYDAFACDFSEDGIAFLTTAPLRCERYVLLLPRRDGSALKVLTQVRYCDEIAAGIYHVGACFLPIDREA